MGEGRDEGGGFERQNRRAAAEERRHRRQAMSDGTPLAGTHDVCTCAARVRVRMRVRVSVCGRMRECPCGRGRDGGGRTRTTVGPVYRRRCGMWADDVMHSKERRDSQESRKPRSFAVCVRTGLREGPVLRRQQRAAMCACMLAAARIAPAHMPRREGRSDK
jgi:hypothetical protein